MNPAILLLTDSRLPAGGHAHSGGAEQAIATGAIRDVESLTAFLKGRLHTSGLVAASFAAASCTLAATLNSRPNETPGAARGGDRSTARGPQEGHRLESCGWEVLDAEVDARTPPPAQRDASRTQGRLLLRVARRLWPSEVLEGLARAVQNPHHPIALGAVAHAAGASSGDAALAAGYHAITGPATAAVRLLGLDPVAVHRVLADLSPDLTTIAASTHPATPSREADYLLADGTPAFVAGASAGRESEFRRLEREAGWAELPAHSAPALDLLAERHVRAEVRLFVS